MGKCRSEDSMLQHLKIGWENAKIKIYQKTLKRKHCGIVLEKYMGKGNMKMFFFFLRKGYVFKIKKYKGTTNTRSHTIELEATRRPPVVDKQQKGP